MNKISHITVFIISLVVCLTSNIAESQEQIATIGMSTLPEVAASFTIEVTSIDQVDNGNFAEEIQVWRNHNLFEIKHTKTSFGEYWGLLKNGRVQYSWIHHNRKFIVKHEATFSNSPDAGLLYWESKATFFNKTFLSELTKMGESNFNGYPSEQYEGILNGEFVSVNWLPTLSLPVSIEQTGANDKYSITLKEIYPLDDSPFTSINTANYKDIDFVDFEDDELDPDVQFYRRVLNEEEHAH